MISQARFDPGTGNLIFSSYRDPQLSDTLNVYENALNWLNSDQWNEQDVKEAILQTCGSLDRPTAPASMALNEWNKQRAGSTYPLREQFRKGVLQTTRDELLKSGAQWLTNSKNIAVITNAEKAASNQNHLEQIAI